MSINYPTLVNFSHFRHLRSIWIRSIITYFQIHSILTNKPNFRNDKRNISIDMTSVYKIFCCSPGAKNKPNSKPIKPKTNPIKANSNPIQTQFVERPKMLEFTLSLSPSPAHLMCNRGMLAHLLIYQK